MRSAGSRLSRRSLLLAACVPIRDSHLGGVFDSEPPRGMVLVPGGPFEMGSSAAEIAAKHEELGPRLRAMLLCETPRHTVVVRPFFMDRHETTNREFAEFIGHNPSWGREKIPPQFHNGAYLRDWVGSQYPRGTGDYPVVNITWYATVAYALWAGKRLPTESEWEYAACGGRQRPEYPWGDNPPTPARANFSASGVGRSVPVEQYPPNGFGLFDMAGNVWEFCLDPWTDSYTPDAAAAGERSPAWILAHWREVRTRRVIRGGSWGGAPINLRVRFRDSHPPDGAGAHVGFRCVVSA